MGDQHAIDASQHPTLASRHGCTLIDIVQKHHQGCPCEESRRIMKFIRNNAASVGGEQSKSPMAIGRKGVELEGNGDNGHNADSMLKIFEEAQRLMDELERRMAERSNKGGNQNPDTSSEEKEPSASADSASLQASSDPSMNSNSKINLIEVDIQPDATHEVEEAHQVCPKLIEKRSKPRSSTDEEVADDSKGAGTPNIPDCIDPSLLEIPSSSTPTQPKQALGPSSCQNSVSRDLSDATPDKPSPKRSFGVSRQSVSEPLMRRTRQPVTWLRTATGLAMEAEAKRKRQEQIEALKKDAESIETALKKSKKATKASVRSAPPKVTRRAKASTSSNGAKCASASTRTTRSTARSTSSVSPNDNEAYKTPQAVRRSTRGKPTNDSLELEKLPSAALTQDHRDPQETTVVTEDKDKDKPTPNPESYEVDTNHTLACVSSPKSPTVVNAEIDRMRQSRTSWLKVVLLNGSPELRGPEVDDPMPVEGNKSPSPSIVPSGVAQQQEDEHDVPTDPPCVDVDANSMDVEIQPSPSPQVAPAVAQAALVSQPHAPTPFSPMLYSPYAIKWNVQVERTAGQPPAYECIPTYPDVGQIPPPQPRGSPCRVRPVRDRTTSKYPTYTQPCLDQPVTQPLIWDTVVVLPDFNPPPYSNSTSRGYRRDSSPSVEPPSRVPDADEDLIWCGHTGDLRRDEAEGREVHVRCKYLIPRKKEAIDDHYLLVHGIVWEMAGHKCVWGSGCIGHNISGKNMGNHIWKTHIIGGHKVCEGKGCRLDQVKGSRWCSSAKCEHVAPDWENREPWQNYV
ncbi:hypothetical protein NMY22_g9269 [Coprinellus aureogranulatus]|nr:hypothetical protein NMY22_g9269 [Coprinellus aureogranulatus]